MFTWTDEDRAKLTVGCTVEWVGAEGRERVEYVRRFVRNERDVIETRDCPPGETFAFGMLDCHDPQSIQPPSLATLTRMAVESFGEGASVVQEDWDGECASMQVLVMSERLDGNVVHAEFHVDAARECARWLAARGR